MLVGMLRIAITKSRHWLCLLICETSSKHTPRTENTTQAFDCGTKFLIFAVESKTLEKQTDKQQHKARGQNIIRTSSLNCISPGNPAAIFANMACICGLAACFGGVWRNTITYDGVQRVQKGIAFNGVMLTKTTRRENEVQ